MTAGKRKTRFTNLGLVPQRQTHDEIVGGRCLRRRQHTVEIRLGITKGNVACDRLIKHMIFLKDHSDVPAHIAVIQCFQIDIIEQDRAFSRLEQSGD